MDILKAEIAKKRKLLEERNLIVSWNWFIFCKYFEKDLCSLFDSNQDDKKKYFKRGDLIAQENEECLQEMQKLKQANSEPENSSNSGELVDDLFSYRFS